MLISSSLVFCVSIAAIVLIIHEHDEIHQLMAWLSALTGIVCVFILTPPLIKGLLGLVVFFIGHRLFPVHKSFK